MRRKPPHRNPLPRKAGDVGAATKASHATTVLYATGDETSDFELLESAAPQFVQTANRYEIVAEIARGGVGIVYQAIDTQLHRDVAIKVLRSEHHGRPEIEARFIEEARIMGALQHPGIAPVYEVGRCQDGRPFHVMKLIQGKTLGDLLAEYEPSRSQPEPTPQVSFSTLLNVFSDVCQAVAYTHSRQMLHLDLKPHNVMVGPFSEVHVMDWGLSRSLVEHPKQVVAVAHDPTATVGAGDVAGELAEKSGLHGHVHGTPAYMSPEQARGRRCDKRSDVFGLGAMLCQILTGQPPFRGKNPRQVFQRAANGAIKPALRRLDRSDCDATLVRLAQRCLSVRRSARPSDAGEVAREVSAFHESAIKQDVSDLQRFFELSLDLFCIAGFDGFFRRINENFTKVLGYSSRELLSRRFIEFVHVDDRASTIRKVSLLTQGESVVRFRNRYLAASGQVVHFEWTARSILEQNLIIAVARDVTESPPSDYDLRPWKEPT